MWPWALPAQKSPKKPPISSSLTTISPRLLLPLRKAGASMTTLPRPWRYLLAGNAGELTVMFIAALLGWPLPLLPIQLLWINLVTDGLPALALATDPIDPDVLTRPPRRPEAQLIDWAFFTAHRPGWLPHRWRCPERLCLRVVHDGSLARARNAAFSVLVIEELLRAFSSAVTHAPSGRWVCFRTCSSV